MREHRRSTSLFPPFLETRYAGSLFLLLILLLLPPLLSVHTGDLGKLSTNPFNPDSTANPFGAGSPFKSGGINNPFSPYGSPFSNQSIFFHGKPPAFRGLPFMSKEFLAESEKGNGVDYSKDGTDTFPIMPG